MVSTMRIVEYMLKKQMKKHEVLGPLISFMNSI